MNELTFFNLMTEQYENVENFTTVNVADYLTKDPIARVSVTGLFEVALQLGFTSLECFAFAGEMLVGNENSDIVLRVKQAVEGSNE